MSAKAEKLGLHEHLINIGYWLSRPVAYLLFLQFCWSINTHKSARNKRKNKRALPVTIDMTANIAPPFWAGQHIRKLGVSSFAWGQYYEISNGKKQQRFSISVSSLRAKWAYMNLAQAGWQIDSPALTTKVLPRAPKPWGVNSKDSTIDQHVVYGFGKMLGLIRK